MASPPSVTDKRYNKYNQIMKRIYDNRAANAAFLFFENLFYHTLFQCFPAGGEIKSFSLKEFYK